MNEDRTTSLTTVEIKRLKYPKAQMVDPAILEEEVEANMVDKLHLSTLKKALVRTMVLSAALQKAEEIRKALMNFDLRAHPTIEDISSRIRICERAIEEVIPPIAIADELLVLYGCHLGFHPRRKEEAKTIKANLTECKGFFEEMIKTLHLQIGFIERAEASIKSQNKRRSTPRHIKPNVIIAKPDELTYAYDGDLTRAVYDYLSESNCIKANWDVFNNAVMCGNYAQLDTPTNAKANLCQIIHLFDIYICGGVYGHIAANSIGLNGRTNLTQQASNLPENFKYETEHIFRQWAKKQRRK